MTRKEKFLKQVVRRNNIPFYFSTYVSIGDNLLSIFDNLTQQVIEKIGQKYIDFVILKNITLETEYDSESIQANLVIIELDEDRDIRIQKELENAEKHWIDALVKQKTIKKNRDDLEQKLYLKLKKKYEPKI